MQREKAQLESLWTKHSGWTAVIVALVVSALGYSLDGLLVLGGVPHLFMLLLTNTLTGIVAGGLFFQMARHEKEHRQMMRTRMATIAEMNHHIRNALQVIKILIAGPQGVAHASGQVKLINESVERVEWALREVLPKYPAGTPVEPVPPLHDTDGPVPARDSGRL